MKRLFSILLVIVTLSAVALMASGCMGGKPMSQVVKYVASGEINDASAIVDYTIAIDQVVSDFEEDDAGVGEACDEVYARHKAEKPGLKGMISIEKFSGASDLNQPNKPSRILKMYIYE